jgi:tRNA-dependent cyclodipeptide synthase
MKYKVKIKAIHPAIQAASEKFPAQCFLGVSMSNPFFHGKHLAKTLKWIDDNFQECLIVIADHLHRFNEYTFSGKNGADAEEDCEQMGNEIHERIKSLTSSLSPNKFTITHWLPLTQSNEFTEDSKIINSYFNNNDKFKQSIRNSCKDFIAKQKSRGYHIFINEDDAIHKSQNYLLEEMAVFSDLIRKGYQVQVYPGTQLAVLKELADNKFPDINSPLKNGIYIDLTVKKIR